MKVSDAINAAWKDWNNPNCNYELKVACYEGARNLAEDLEAKLATAVSALDDIYCSRCKDCHAHAGRALQKIRGG